MVLGFGAMGSCLLGPLIKLLFGLLIRGNIFLYPALGENIYVASKYLKPHFF